MHFSQLGFITRPKYLDTFLSNALRVAIGQLRTSSHQLEIENGRTNRVPREERLCRLCYIEIEDEYHFTCKCPTYAEIRAKYQDILGPSPTLSKVLDTPDIKRLGRYILELKQHREDKLQSVNHNHLNIHQHVTNIIFQEQGDMMNVDTPTPLGLSLDEAEMQRTTKRPRMSGFKAIRRGVETIKKIRERELRRLEAMVGVPFTLGPLATSTSKPFDLPLLFERLGWK